MALRAEHGIGYVLARHSMVHGIAWYMLWSGGHGMVYGMAWRAWHGIRYGIVGMAWYMVRPGGHRI